MSATRHAPPHKGTSLRTAIIRVALGIVLFFTIDAALFRSGLYFRFVAPSSGLGNVALVLGNLRRLPPTHDGVVVMGDSRIAEGFSAKTADATAAQAGSPLRFANGGVSSSLPRVWYYLLRQTPSPATRLRAVAIMLTSYHDDDREHQATRRGDMVFVHPTLRLSDLADFPWSFPAWPDRLEATAAILFKGLFYKNDLIDAFADPAKRIADTTLWRKHGHEYSREYPGRAGSIEGMTYDMDTGVLTMDPAHPSSVPNTLTEYAGLLRQYRGRQPENPEAVAYRSEWLGRLADWCNSQGIRLVVFRIPRGPLHHMVDADTTPTGIVAELAAQHRITLLPADSFDSLETPADFFDDLHLNSTGRPIFSAALAAAILQALK